MSRDHDIIYTLLVASMFLFYVTSTMSCCVVWKSTTTMRDRYSLWLLQRRKLGCVLVARSYGVFVGLGYRVFTMKWVIAFRQKKMFFWLGRCKQEWLCRWQWWVEVWMRIIRIYHISGLNENFFLKKNSAICIQLLHESIEVRGT